MSNIVEAKQTSFSLAPQNLEEAFKFAEILSKSKLVPKDFEGNQGNILVAIQWGAELGLQPMQAMQNIAVINGRPSLWGDSVIALVKASPLCEYVVEDVTDTAATCRVKRRGEPEQVRTFTTEDAKKAGLYGKQGPWTQYPKRMMQMRARSWALRDVFPDVLRGMPVAEELMDMPVERDVTPAPAPQQPVATTYLDDATFSEYEKKYKGTVSSGKKKASDFVMWVESMGVLLTDAQKTAVNDWAKPVVVEGQASQVNDPFVDEMNQAEGA